MQDLRKISRLAAAGSLGLITVAAALAARNTGSAWLRSILIAIAAVAAAAVLLVLLSNFDHRSRAIIRLDWFLPAIRRQRDGQSPPGRLLGRWLRRLLPTPAISNHTTKKRGMLRRLLRRMGISWLASPPRRMVQAICLIAFLVSFFYVCWPYGARPADPPPMVPGLQLIEIDQDSGEFRFGLKPHPPWLAKNREPVFVSDPVDFTIGGSFDVSDVSENRLSLLPTGDVSDEFFDAVLTRETDWSIHQSDPNAWPSHYTDALAAKEKLPAEFFLTIDPLVSLSTAIASRSWVWSLVCAAVILIVCLLIPRGFCGYLCPLGTTIDLFDWAIGSRINKFRVAEEGWWVHIKYYLLAGTLIAALGGVLVSGFFSAIPVITRGLLFIGEPLQSGTMRGWHLVPAMNGGHLISVAMFLAVLCLGFLRPRFWCKYVCPSGALFSVGNLFRLTERKVESSCIHCNKCVEVCPFDAIKPDFTTRTTDCTMCQTCGGVCPTHAIKFVERGNVVELKVEDDPPTKETSIGRRGFLSLAAGSTAATVGGIGAAGAAGWMGADLDDADSFRPVRPPGSVPEQEFLQMCIRCGECFKVCPNNVLQAEGFEQGLEGLWTPLVNADWAGCESSCNACGQVCPTGAIRPLPLEEKKVARMGLAVVNQQTCLPFAGHEDCDLCIQECNAAGYYAIEYVQVGTQVDENQQPIEGTGMLAPVVLDDKCVGCGLCQTRCYGINVKEKGLLDASAIIIEAGEGKEDRLLTGSYIQLRGQRESAQTGQPQTESNFFRPDEKAEQESPVIESDNNPFGI